MDEGRFDALTRALGAARTRRGAIGALAALLGGATVIGVEETDARRRRRRRCNPRCPTAQTCNRKTRTCVCPNGGTVCGVNCCTGSQVCEGGFCVTPSPGPTCHEFGSRECNGTNLPCCGSDLRCASGQGGKFDVACYKKVDVACAASSECIYGTECRNGVCTLIQPPPPCNADTCAGCCDGGVCRGGTDAAFCGSGGAACVACDTSEQTCQSGTCTALNGTGPARRRRNRR